MDPRVMELRIRQWIPVFEEQAARHCAGMIGELMKELAE